MIKNSFKIVINAAAIGCPAAATIKELVSKLNAGENLPVKSFISDEKEMVGYPIYVDSISSENQYGFVKSIYSEEQTLDDDDIKLLVKEGNYEVLLNETTSKQLTGTLNILIDEGAACQKSDSALSSEIREAANEVIAKGVVTEEEMNKRLKYMADNYIDNFLQLRVISGYRNYNKPCHKPSCLYADPYLEDSRNAKREGIISEGLRSAVAHQAIICEGEKSVGKNVYLETIAWLLNMPMYLITFSRQMSPSSIYGEKTTDNSASNALAELDPKIIDTAEKAKFARKCWIQSALKQGEPDVEEYVSALMPEEWANALEEMALFEKRKAQAQSVNIVIDQSELYDWLVDGGLMCFNEMNMCEANFFASFSNQLLDGTGFLFIPGRGEVKIHQDCVLFGTQNADYQGVETQNEATMSRFGCIVFPQPKSIKAQLMVATKSAIRRGTCSTATLDSKYYAECQTFYEKCRGAVNGGQLSNACLNIRGFVRALTAVAESSGYARLKRQVEIHVINTCPTDDRMALNAMLEQIITL